MGGDLLTSCLIQNQTESVLWFLHCPDSVAPLIQNDWKVSLNTQCNITIKVHPPTVLAICFSARECSRAVNMFSCVFSARMFVLKG